MNGYRSQTYSFWNEKGDRYWVKFHFKTQPRHAFWTNAQAAAIRKVINRLNECCDDSVPTEGWGDRSQNCLHDMRIVGNT
jgi:hypothetical protein